MIWEKITMLGALVGVLVVCAPAQSLIIRGGDLCPQAFIGRVDAISEGQPPYTTLSKNEVTFKVLRSLRGKLGDQEVLSILKYGPLRLEKGATYMISLRQKKICSLEKNDQLAQD